MKEGFGASAADVSLLSAGLPKANVGGGCSVGALGLLKEKPPELAGAGVASASLLAASKRKADRPAPSFFSSGFPKVNVGAAGSLSVGKEPNVEPPCGVVVAKLRSPSLPKTDPAVVVLVADVVSFDDAALSLFSWEETGAVKVTEDDVMVSDVFSSGFDSLKEKPPLVVLLSVLDDPVPKTIPSLAPNLNPEPVLGSSDFLSSPEAAPNLKPSPELPNLNPDEAVESLEVDSDEEIPNLNPPDDDSDNTPPNLKPPDPDPSVLSDAPNLKPPDPEVLSDVPNLIPPELEEPNVEEPAAVEPKAEEKQKTTKPSKKRCGFDVCHISTS